MILVARNFLLLSSIPSSIPSSSYWVVVFRGMGLQNGKAGNLGWSGFRNLKTNRNRYFPILIGLPEFQFAEITVLALAKVKPVWPWEKPHAGPPKPGAKDASDDVCVGAVVVSSHLRRGSDRCFMATYGTRGFTHHADLIRTDIKWCTVTCTLGGLHFNVILCPFSPVLHHRNSYSPQGVGHVSIIINISKIGEFPLLCRMHSARPMLI